VLAIAPTGLPSSYHLAMLATPMLLLLGLLLGNDPLGRTEEDGDAGAEASPLPIDLIDRVLFEGIAADSPQHDPLGVDQFGSIYFADHRRGAVRVFDKNGSETLVLDGFATLERPPQWVAADGSHIWVGVSDHPSGLDSTDVEKFGRDGEFLGNVEIPSTEAFLLRRWHVIDDDRWVVRYDSLRLDPAVGPPAVHEAAEGCERLGSITASAAASDGSVALLTRLPTSDPRDYVLSLRRPGFVLKECHLHWFAAKESSKAVQIPKEFGKPVSLVAMAMNPHIVVLSCVAVQSDSTELLVVQRSGRMFRTVLDGRIGSMHLTDDNELWVFFAGDRRMHRFGIP